MMFISVHGIGMENLLDDMSCDRYIIWMYKLGEFPDVIKAAESRKVKKFSGEGCKTVSPTTVYRGAKALLRRFMKNF